MEQITNFESMLAEVEDSIGRLSNKPSTRVEACQLLAKAKALQTEVNEFNLPDLEAEYTEEEGERLDTALERYNQVRQLLADTQAKAETLCVCWDKLDQDVSELTKLLTNGGGSRITIDRLEQSISQLREMFSTRKTITDTLAPAAADEYSS